MASDDAGFREFVEARYTDLLRVAYHLTGSAYEAEDLVQSALVKAMGRWKRIDDPDAYLRRVMINHRTSVWRRWRSREVPIAVLPDRPAGDAADRVVERQAMYQAMRSLSPRTRAVIVLRYVADLSEAQVAAVLDCSVGTVKSSASRGLARLREALGPTQEPASPSTCATAKAACEATRRATP
jgi:RNA polymerase sigma-70 factor (sigma-E family)